MSEDKEGLIGLLSGGKPGLTVVSSIPTPNPEPVSTSLLETDPNDEWAEDPVSVKWDKIRRVFLNGKSPAELAVAAASMSTPQWLDIAMRMAPKDIKVTGEVSFKHMLAELGPIDKEKYRPGVVDVEFSEVPND